MEIDLLKHSTYNVEKVKKNKEFFYSLLDKLKSTYQIFNFRERSESNKINIEFAPQPGTRIQNVFFQMNANGEIEFTVRGSTRKLKEIPSGKFKLSEYSMDTTLKIEGINSENYQEHLPVMVKAIEICEYSFK
jgi:hypothetical protein